MTVTVVEYDTTWPGRATEACEALLTALPGVFVEIEHLGSTSIPGLVAKPVIDLMASVRSLDDVPEDRLAALGYHFFDAGMSERLFYVRDTDGERSHHLHVVTADTWDTRNERTLRDYLRAHPDDAAAYGQLKLRLAASGISGPDYTRAKTELIQRLVDAARDERGLPRVTVWEE